MRSPPKAGPMMVPQLREAGSREPNAGSRSPRWGGTAPTLAGTDRFECDLGAGLVAIAPLVSWLGRLVDKASPGTLGKGGQSCFE